MGRVRDRIGDKRILGLVKAFLKSGILTEDGRMTGTKTGTPQGRYVKLHINRPMNSAGLCAVLTHRAW